MKKYAELFENKIFCSDVKISKLRSHLPELSKQPRKQLKYLFYFSNTRSGPNDFSNQWQQPRWFVYFAFQSNHWHLFENISDIVSLFIQFHLIEVMNCRLALWSRFLWKLIQTKSPNSHILRLNQNKYFIYQILLQIEAMT